MTLDNYIFEKFKKYSKIRYWENRINILRNVDVTAKKYVVYIKNALHNRTQCRRLQLPIYLYQKIRMWGKNYRTINTSIVLFLAFYFFENICYNLKEI